MLKNLVKKNMTKNKADKQASNQSGQGDKSDPLQQVTGLAVNEVLAEQLLIDTEEERLREIKFKNDHVEYLRVARKPLLFGMEENVTYTQHAHMSIQGCIQNFNNK